MTKHPEISYRPADELRFLKLFGEKARKLSKAELKSIKSRNLKDKKL